jgi:small subunit ribosomal protein S2
MSDTKKTKGDFNIDLEAMAAAGVQFGHKTSRINPKMNQYLAGVRSGTHLIDLEKTKEKLSLALEFIQKLISEGKTLLLVGTKVEVKGLVKSVAEECGLPYVSERWLGGTFTNFEAILKRVDYFKDLERQKAAGELEKYTKKEKADFEEEIKNLNKKFGSIRDMRKLPEAIFVVDINEDGLAVKEAKDLKVTVLGICDTNADPTSVYMAIPASDDSVSSVKYILEKVKEVILKSKSLPAQVGKTK